jgi:hypothetical protein
MRVFDKRTRLQRLVDSAPSTPASKAAKAGVIAVTGVGGLIAASAGISSRRRRLEETVDEDPE